MRVHASTAGSSLEIDDVCAHSVCILPLKHCHHLLLSRRPHDPEGSFVVDVSITEVCRHKINSRFVNSLDPLAHIQN